MAHHSSNDAVLQPFFAASGFPFCHCLWRHPASVRLLVLLSAEDSFSVELSTLDLSESMTVSISLTWDTRGFCRIDCRTHWLFSIFSGLLGSIRMCFTCLTVLVYTI